MKSKLTLRLDDEIKKRAKEWAKQHGTSVSKIVEDYFRLLVREPNGEPASDVGPPDTGDLPPLTRRMKESLGQPAPKLELDDDTKAWIDAAAKKHT